jgi:hypothetical protein
MKLNQALAIGCACAFLTTVIASDSMARRKGSEEKPTPAAEPAGNTQAAAASTAGAENPAAAPETQAAAASVENPPAAVPAGALMVPAGTKLLVQLSQNVSTSKNAAGQKFQAILQGNLAVDKQVIAADGSKVFGVVQPIKDPEGKSVMALFLSEIMINGQLQPIVTQPLGIENPSAGKAAAAGAVKGAVVGAAFGHHGGSAAAGAAIGAAAAGSKAKKSAGVPAGQLLDFYLAEPLVVSGP